MIVMQGVFHSNPFSGFRYTPSRKSPLLGVILLRPELRPFIIIIPMSFSICDTFDKTHVPYIRDFLHIIRSVFKPQFIHYSKYAKYAFLLLFSIYTQHIGQSVYLLSFLVSFKQEKSGTSFDLKCNNWFHLPESETQIIY